MFTRPPEGQPFVVTRCGEQKARAHARIPPRRACFQPLAVRWMYASPSVTYFTGSTLPCAHRNRCSVTDCEKCTQRHADSGTTAMSCVVYLALAVPHDDHAAHGVGTRPVLMISHQRSGNSLRIELVRDVPSDPAVALPFLLVLLLPSSRVGQLISDEPA